MKKKINYIFHKKFFFLKFDFILLLGPSVIDIILSLIIVKIILKYILLVSF
jgi:hypothetical protein